MMRFYRYDIDANATPTLGSNEIAEEEFTVDDILTDQLAMGITPRLKLLTPRSI